jgi:hypothetical protein
MLVATMPVAAPKKAQARGKGWIPADGIVFMAAALYVNVAVLTRRAAGYTHR